MQCPTLRVLSGFHSASSQHRSRGCDHQTHGGFINHGPCSQAYTLGHNFIWCIYDAFFIYSKFLSRCSERTPSQWQWEEQEHAWWRFCIPAKQTPRWLSLNLSFRRNAKEPNEIFTVVKVFNNTSNTGRFYKVFFFLKFLKLFWDLITMWWKDLAHVTSPSPPQGLFHAISFSSPTQVPARWRWPCSFLSFCLCPSLSSFRRTRRDFLLFQTHSNLASFAAQL